jgi:hypothetical protein
MQVAYTKLYFRCLPLRPVETSLFLAAVAGTAIHRPSQEAAVW